MRRSRRLLLVLAASFPLSQVGHALASALRGGGMVPAGAAHAYFAADLAASAAVLGVAAAAAGAVLFAARVSRGDRLGVWRRSAWPLAWTFLALAALQLEVFLVQELLEGATTIDVAWRGLLGQLPVAAAAAVTIHALSVRLGPARRQLRRRARLLLVALAPAPIAPAAELTPLAGRRPLRSRETRAPPSSLHLAVV